MSKSRIRPEQYVEICEWLKTNRDRVQRTEMTQLEAATAAESALGYRVPRSTIIRMAVLAGVTWAKSPLKPPPVPLDYEAIVILMGAIAGLYVETGKTVPDALANLQSRYIKKETKI